MSTRITTRYLSATDTKGSRIRATWTDEHGARRAYTEGFDHSANDPHQRAAERALGRAVQLVGGSANIRRYEVVES